MSLHPSGAAKYTIIEKNSDTKQRVYIRHKALTIEEKMINMTSSKLKSSALQKKMKGNEKERQTNSNHSAYIWHSNLYPKHIKNSYNLIKPPNL